MDPVLIQLQKKMPPLTGLKSNDVNWDKLEAAIGVTYPQSFKDFVAVYGGAIWFDLLSLFYDEAASDASINQFMKSLESKITDMKNNTVDNKYRKISVPYYPEPAGMFPFMIDYNGNNYCWSTEHKSPDKWPIVCWHRGPLLVFKNTTLAKLILDWLEGKPKMNKLWGKIKDLEPARIRLDPA